MKKATTTIFPLQKGQFGSEPLNGAFLSQWIIVSKEYLDKIKELKKEIKTKQQEIVVLQEKLKFPTMKIPIEIMEMSFEQQRNYLIQWYQQRINKLRRIKIEK